MILDMATVCSGIGAPEQAAEGLPINPVFCAEIEPFPCEVLKIRHPHIPNYGDITNFKKWPTRPIHLLVGGTPCQSFSVAGLRKGLDDPRGNLALVFLAIVDRFRPTWVLWENVPGIHSSWSDGPHSIETKATAEAGIVNRRLAREAGFDDEAARLFGDVAEFDQTNDFDCFLSGLEQLGYGVATRIFDTQFFGLPQRRERVFVVGHSGGQWQRAAAVLFDRESLRGNPPPRREAREGTAVVSPIGTRSGIAADRGDGLIKSIRSTDVGISREDADTLIPDVAWALQERDSKGTDSDTKDGHLLPVVSFNSREDPLSGDIPGSLGSSSPQAQSIQTGYAVRRLTPKECERLQGFPDDYTRIHYRNKPADLCPDGPRYKALGNSMSVPVIRWILKRILAVHEIK